MLWCLLLLSNLCHCLLALDVRVIGTEAVCIHIQLRSRRLHEWLSARRNVLIIVQGLSGEAVSTIAGLACHYSA